MFPILVIIIILFLLFYINNKRDNLENFYKIKNKILKEKNIIDYGNYYYRKSNVPSNVINIIVHGGFSDSINMFNIDKRGDCYFLDLPECNAIDMTDFYTSYICDFIQTQSADKEINLIGHSIGAYFCINAYHKICSKLGTGKNVKLIIVSPMGIYDKQTIKYNLKTLSLLCCVNGLHRYLFSKRLFMKLVGNKYSKDEVLYYYYKYKCNKDVTEKIVNEYVDIKLNLTDADVIFKNNCINLFEYFKNNNLIKNITCIHGIRDPIVDFDNTYDIIKKYNIKTFYLDEDHEIVNLNLKGL
jgi:hypothetical protein